MGKLPMCRICLVENVHMYVVVNTNLHELYEKLTDIPFVTEDRRPILVCFFCCAKLKQCYRLLRQCLKAEELFAQIMNEDYEPNSSINQDHLEFCGGFIKSPIVLISIDDECQEENIDIKEELPAVCEGLDDIIEPKEERLSDELEWENFDNSCLDIADIRPHHSESDLEDDVPLKEFRTESKEETDRSKTKRRAIATKSTNVAKKPKLEARRTKLEDGISAKQTRKEKSDSKVIRTTQKHMSESVTYLKEPYECDQRSFNPVKNMIQHSRTDIDKKLYKCDICQRSFCVKYSLTNHIRTHTGEKPYKCDVCQRRFCEKSALTKHIRVHTGEKPFKCDVCQHSFSHKINLTSHTRIHTGERPFKCDICERKFSEKSTLTKHIRLHTGEKPFKCDICQRSFRKNNYLKTHILIHTGEKPFKCDICQRSFREKCTLKKHMRIHTGKKLN